MNAVLLQPLPYPHPERLALVSYTAGGGAPEGNTAVDGRTRELLRDRATSVNRAVLSTSDVHSPERHPGFDPSQVVSAAVSLEDARYRTAGSVSRLMDATLARLQQEPGITSAAVGLGLPYERLLNLGFRHADGPEASDTSTQITNATYVTPAFFDVLRIPVRARR